MRTFTRRNILAFTTAVAFLIPGFFRRAVALSDDEELILINGWILRRSDVTMPSR